MSECTNGEMRDLLPELVSGRLGAEMQLAAEAHVAECEECAEELALLRSLRPMLMRGPVVDAERIAAAVRAQVRPGRDVVRPRFATPWRIAIAAAALIAVSAVGYAVVRKGGGAGEVAVVPPPDTTSDSATRAPAPTPKVSTPRTAPVPPQQVAVAPPHVSPPNPAPTTVASVGVFDNLSDLSDDDVRTLTASLEGLSSVPDADPGADIDPLGASLDDNSGGST